MAGVLGGWGLGFGVWVGGNTCSTKYETDPKESACLYQAVRTLS